MTTQLVTRQPRDGVVEVVTLGVDTHQQAHHAAVLDSRGGVLGDREFPATAAGYVDLLAWACGHGFVEQAGVESTGSYGAGLAKFLTSAGVRVSEVNKPVKRDRAMRGKSDRLDAVSAARQVQAGTAVEVAKQNTGAIEAIRVLKVARDSAVKARTATYSQIRDVITTAPEEIRAVLLTKTARQRVKVCLALRPSEAAGVEMQAVKTALRALARRVRELDDEVRELDALLKPLVHRAAPSLVGLKDVSTQIGAQLLITAGSNVERMKNEATFARLTGVAPIPASSGKTNRYRLSRGGDRQANSALYWIVIGRMARDPQTRAYVERRTREGLSKKDIIRCLKRYVARSVFNALKTDLATT